MQLLRRNYLKIAPSLRRPTAAFLQTSPKPSSKILLRPFNSSSAVSLARPTPNPPSKEERNRTGKEAPTFLGTQKRLPEFNLADHVVLVSGGAGGLGLVQSEALLEAGATGKIPAGILDLSQKLKSNNTVYALDRREVPPTEFDRVCERAKSTLGAALHYRQIDVTDESGLRRVIADIAEKHGRLDGLIAAAGINKEGDSLDYTAQDFNRILKVNVTGVFSTAQAVAKEMINRGTGGSICLIASMSGTIANRVISPLLTASLKPQLKHPQGLICAAYNSSKAAVCQLSRNLASEWGRYGIRVNSISPGYILTPMTKHDFMSSPERERFLSDGNMLGRLSTPEEYRGAGVFLISSASSFMTGSDLIIDGGHHSW